MFVVVVGGGGGLCVCGICVWLVCGFCCEICRFSVDASRPREIFESPITYNLVFLRIHTVKARANFHSIFSIRTHAESAPPINTAMFLVPLTLSCGVLAFVSPSLRPVSCM